MMSIHSSQNLGLIIRTFYFHSRQNLMRGWIYRNVIYSFPTIFGGGHYIVILYFHPWQYLVRGWLYSDIIFSLLTILVRGVITSWHYIFTRGNIWWGGDYIVTKYCHSWQYLVRGWLYCDIISSLLAIFGEGWLYRDIIFSPLTIFGQGGDYIVTSYFHFWQYWWGVIISWHDILTPDNIFVRGWLYRDIIFSLLAIFGEGVIITWHYIFTPDNIWCRGDYIVTLHFKSWWYLGRGWLYRHITLSFLTLP